MALSYSAYVETDFGSKIPSHWSTDKIKFCVSYNDESLPETTDPDKELFYVDISSVDLIQGITNIEVIPFGKAPSRARRIVRNGDTIVSTVRTYLKAIAPIKNPPDNMIVSTGFAVIRPKQNVIPSYLSYYFQSQDFVDAVGANSIGVSYPAINPSTLVSIPCSYPPDNQEQIKITKFLDYKISQIDRLIEKKKALIENLKEQRITIINQVVTKGLKPDVPVKNSGFEWLEDVPAHWTLRKMRHLFSFGRGLGITKSDLREEGIPCLNYGEIHSKYSFEVIPEKHELKCVAEAYLSEGTSSLLQYGDFVFADTSEDIEGAGNFSYMNGHLPTFAGYHTITAKLETNDIPRFLAYQFDSIMFRHQIRKSVTGVKVFSVTQQILKGCSVWLPPESEQLDIVAYLDTQLNTLDDMLKVNDITIDKLNEYRTALITAAVTGQIDIRSYQIPEEF